MLTTAKKMLEENNFCVLATCSDNRPNSSLMHYVFDDAAMRLYMLCLQGSVKHKNITANPQVSLLVDTRLDVPQPGLPVAALTVYGQAELVQDPQVHQDRVNQLKDKYAGLAKLADDERCLVIEMQIKKMMLLDGVNDQRSIEI